MICEYISVKWKPNKWQSKERLTISLCKWHNLWNNTIKVGCNSVFLIKMCQKLSLFKVKPFCVIKKWQNLREASNQCNQLKGNRITRILFMVWTKFKNRWIFNNIAFEDDIQTVTQYKRNTKFKNKCIQELHKTILTFRSNDYKIRVQ